MYKVFIPEPLPNIPQVAFIADRSQEGNKLFQTIPPDAYKNIFARVLDATQADIVIAPHEYVQLRNHPSYLARCQDTARMAHIPLLVSAYQDDARPIALPGTFVLRPSAYRTALSAREILMPAYVEDVGAAWGIEPLPKGEKPIVSFVGKADFSSLGERIRYVIRNYAVRHGPRKQGIYFRRHALSSLAADPRIVLNTIVRKRYSAHRNTIEVPPAQARAEYIRSIQHAHFTLAPGGDGNYSLRFYETLALGRIPILIDTDMPLPLQDRIDYNACIVRVPWRDIAHIGDYVIRFFNDRSENSFIEAQKNARNVFGSYLYMPRFLEHLFADILPKRG
ncbi:MAG: Exostosin family protein [Parcubacteria group bacterium GW2011_GWB1_57_6]|nr:MAG: Exostosin family protein [Parcubacteria group bacterium GW2011_GWA1_56_13]KKW46302.1 MAG: Exostosin family protein [Parcubacteria group bacterium GW2011_GWB1_57_6]